jgi:hypothetical protein
MMELAPISEAALAQARRDPVFRRQLLAKHLEHLLAALNLLRSTDSGTDPVRAEQIREGVTLAMRLSNILHALDHLRG